MTTSRVTNALTTVAVIIVTALVVEQRWTQHKDSQRRIEYEQALTYQPGKVLEDTPELKLSDSRGTLLVGTASTCKFCTASMPFYSKLFTLASTKGVRVVAFTLEDVEQNRDYFLKHSVTPDKVVSATANGITLSATPTLVLVQPNGMVVRAWTGQLNRSQEEEVIALIEESHS